MEWRELKIKPHNSELIKNTYTRDLDYSNEIWGIAIL